MLSTLFVATSGSDANAPGNPNAPLLSIQHAVTVAQSGDTIELAAGTYTYNAAADAEGAYTKNFGTTTVFTMINKQLTIIGGFSTSNWSVSNPPANPTMIDGQNTYRGVLVVGGGTTPTSLTLQGVTVENGIAHGIPARGGTEAINALGGGLYADIAPVTLIGDTFLDDQAIGNNTTTSVGGAGAGGGVALVSSANTTVGTLQNDSFINDAARGGSGTSAGGLGQGGGLFSYQYTVNANGLTFNGNKAIGGSTSGGGAVNGLLSDAQGGGLAIHIGSVGNLANLLVENNEAIGGAAPNGDAGGAYGGGVYAERATLNLNAATVMNNTALGGNGINNGTSGAGFGNGGGLMTINSNTAIDRSTFFGNLAKGGIGAVYAGVSGGGGLALVRETSYATTATVANSVIDNNTQAFGGGSNLSRGGGGGGFWIDGPTTTITQSTIADNLLTGSNPSQPAQVGQAIIIGPGVPTTLTLSYNIIADQVNTLNAGNGFAAALSVPPGSTAILNTNLFAGNSNNTNITGSPSPAGTYQGYGTSLTAASAGFVAPGAPLYDYALTSTSPAVNAATGSTDPVDITGLARQGVPDLGAYEYRVSVAGDFDGDGKTDRAVFRPATAQWFISGSALGQLSPTSFGAPNFGDIPVPGDYDRIGHAEVAVFRPATAQWFVQEPNGSTKALESFGAPNLFDLPVPGDYLGLGHTELAVFRPSTAQWFVQQPNGLTKALGSFGAPNLYDIPVPGDYLGLGHTELAVFRPSTAQWLVQAANGSTVVLGPFGAPNLFDLPVPGDYLGLGHTELAVFRPSTAQWFVQAPNGSTVVLGPYGAPNLGDFPTATSVASLVRLGLGGIHATSLRAGSSDRGSGGGGSLFLTAIPAASPVPTSESGPAAGSSRLARRPPPSLTFRDLVSRPKQQITILPGSDAVSRPRVLLRPFETGVNERR